jgi:CrcB protein
VSDPTDPANARRLSGPAGSAGPATAAAVPPQIDLRTARRRPEPLRVPWATLGAISVGGVLGALARHGLSGPHAPGSFGWATFGINVSGCLLIGVLMVAITEVWQAHALVRPFLGVGVLGGFTTFSTYIVDVQRAAASGATHVAVAYLAGTMIAALAAVYAGDRLTRLVISACRGPGAPAGDANGAADGAADGAGDGAVDEVHRGGGDGRRTS